MSRNIKLQTTYRYVLFATHKKTQLKERTSINFSFLIEIKSLYLMVESKNVKKR